MIAALKQLFSRKKEYQPTLVLPVASPLWTSPSYIALAREGYQQNPYVYACVRLIATACGGIPWLLYERTREGLKELEDHPLLSIMNAPNPTSSGSEFIQEVVSYLLISGNAYVQAIYLNERPRELWALRPDAIEVVPGNTMGEVRGYRYNVQGGPVMLSPQQVLHLKLFSPLDSLYGMSPLLAAARSVDQNNEARAWNVALLQNSCRPPGALVSQNQLTDTQFEQLKKELKEQYQGAANAGRPLLLEGGLSWQEMSLTPEEMAWLEGQKLSAREICVCFGVPPQLVGDTESSTYSNYQEARQAFYTETVLPLMDYLRDELNAWLAPQFGPYLLDYDRDEIEALQEDRAATWERALEAVKAGVITVNEARRMMGYEDIKNGDVLLPPQA